MEMESAQPKRAKTRQSNGEGSSAFLPPQTLNEITGFQESSVVTRKNTGKGKRSPLASTSQGVIKTLCPPAMQVNGHVESENSLADTVEALSQVMDGPPLVNASPLLLLTGNDFPKNDAVQTPLQVEYNLPQTEITELPIQTENNSNQNDVAQIVDELLTVL